MAWRNIVVTQHSKIKYKMNHLIVQTDSEIFQIPLDDIQAIIITTTQAVITTYAIAEIIKSGIKIVFPDINGMPIGEISAYHLNSNRNTNIHKQINWRDEEKLQLWSKIIKTKITNQITLLAEIQNDDIDSLKTTVREIKTGDESNREAVAARLYFPRLFDKNFIRSDDENVINGMLDYGYSILLASVSREIAAAGYLTELAIHHQGPTNFYNLASDLMEPLRPIIDRIVKQHENSTELTNEIKFKLIDSLNHNLILDGQEMLVNQAITNIVRTSINYLNQESELPEWEFKI
jgi:CRISPR-associated protein Cas1